MTLAEARRRYPGAETFTFGDRRALCDDLLALVRAGRMIARGLARPYAGGRRGGWCGEEN